MKLNMVGCTHHASSLEIRQLLAFSDRQAICALRQWREQQPQTEMVLVSTCNRVELYASFTEEKTGPTSYDENDESDDESDNDKFTSKLIHTLLDFHQIPHERVSGQMLTLSGQEVVDHLYRVTSSLDSMVVGEPQILSQIKTAYRRAQNCDSTGSLMHALFQSALRTAKRVAGETSLHEHRVSIPSVAIADFASRVFERFDDKRVLVVGAGEMANETLQYLQDAGAKQIHVINRDAGRGEALAVQWSGSYHPWSALEDQLVRADMVISTTAATESIVTAPFYHKQVAPHRHQRSLFILDLAVPRDFDPQIGDALGVYLYSVDDLKDACQRHQNARQQEMPAAEKIVQQETDRFFAEVHHRITAPVISGLRQGLERPKKAELERLFHKLPELDDQAREEISQFADRLVNKMLHPPMQSLRDASEPGAPLGLLDAVKRLFQLQD
jgi:glutamyl-tRNA reductase